MIAALLLQVADAPAVPTDWSALTPLPYTAAPTITPPLAEFVASEIAGGRCAVAKPADGHYLVRVDVATLVGSDGRIRRTVPRAIDCPTVEQYAAGLVISFARGNLSQRSVGGDTWYRATIVFDWHQ